MFFSSVISILQKAYFYVSLFLSFILAPSFLKDIFEAMRIQKDIQELVEAEVISEETAENIRAYYQKKQGRSANRLLTVFSILGAILVGLGIILIIAHNWDEFTRSTRTVFAFLPLIASQGFCGTVLLKQFNSPAWREGAAAFLFFAVGACISLVSQIYHIPGDIDSFLLTWMPLTLPVMYFMRSSVTSLLYLAGITAYIVYADYLSHTEILNLWYWLLLLLGLPYYYWLYKEKPYSNFMVFHNWFIPLSVVIALGSLAMDQGEFMNIAYVSLFGIFYLFGRTLYFQRQPIINNGYVAIGALGTIFLLLRLSFDGFWQQLRISTYTLDEVLFSPEMAASVILTIAAGLMLAYHAKINSLKTVTPIGLVFIFFILTVIIGRLTPLGAIFINLIALAVGVMVIRDGARKDNLRVLNFGLLIIVGLVACRYFDENLSFIVRGILFVLVGIGFFTTNILMIRKRKANEQ